MRQETIMSKEAYVYMMTNYKDNVIYTGITCDLVKKVYEHKYNLVEGFASRYKIKKLVYFEKMEDIEDAVEREKQIKTGSRLKQTLLIESKNMEWRDLYFEIL